MGPRGETEQLNVRMPVHIVEALRIKWVRERTSPREQIMHALCETYGWSPEGPSRFIDGQLTVEQEETLSPDEESATAETLSRADGSSSPPARPRAAEQAERPTGEPADDSIPSAGCPECGGDIVQDGPLVRACVDCGWSPE